MSEDPKLFDAGDYNLFRYCHNDPIDNVDPMGLEENLAQKPISAWDPTGRAWLKQLHDAVQEMLRRAARERAYARAYSGGNYEGGTAYIGMAKFHMAQVSVAGREGKGSESWRNAQAQAILDKWAGLAYESRKEVAGTLNSSGQAILGPERGRYPTRSDPGPVTADTVAIWHFHHLLPGTAPYKFSYPNDERMIQAHPNLSHYVGVLNAPAGQFTIFAYTPETPWLHYIRLGPQPFPQPPSY